MYLHKNNAPSTTQQTTGQPSTELKTLWSETLLEMLYDAVQHNWSANAIKEILKGLHHKGYRLPKVKNKLRRRFGDAGPRKLMLLIGPRR